MFFQNLARGIDIGAHSYLLDLDGVRVVLDAGTHPKIDGLGTLPDFSRLDGIDLDAILVTHAHLDHMGALPVLCREHPEALVALTPETLALGAAMLHNSVNVMEAQRQELGVMAYPLYTHRELDGMEPMWLPRPFGRAFSIGDDRGETAEAVLFPAGHVLGAAGVRLRRNGKTIFYTGDVHFEEQSLVAAADFPDEPVDVLILESTRGDSARSPGYTREAETARLADGIRHALAGGGSVTIPVFALGKTQELLAMLLSMMRRGQLPPTPVQIGGLSTKMTAIHDEFASRSRRLLPGFRFLDDFPDLWSPRRRTREIEHAPGRIYALSSGMMTENTLSNGFARKVVGDPRNALFFIGYADPDSPAGRVLAAKPGDKVPFDARDPDSARTIRCEVDKFDFSGHAPREQLVEFAVKVRPSRIILVHGDEAARQWLKTAIESALPGCQVAIPEAGERIDF
ncbi:MAG: MBL fold metallo-hydrolase [Verrucomicrobiae bacterium]|nr:MBL fold metallo-hydrolase [Verrucomicrobiae bacterium]